MPFNVADFASNIGRHGTLQTNKFEVAIRDIGSLRLGGNQLSLGGRTLFDGMPERLSLSADEKFAFDSGRRLTQSRIDSIKLPSVTIDTYESRRYGVGPNIKAGTNVRFEPFSVSVIVDKEYDLYKYFFTWINTVFDFSGSLYSGSSFNGGFSPTYLTTYKSDYATVIDVRVYENTGQLKATYQFINAFPIGLTNPSLSWRDNNSLLKFDVTFDYTNWVIDTNIRSLNDKVALDTIRSAIATARAENP